MQSLIDANRACIQQGIEFLRKMDSELYGRKCPECFNSSIGGHFRHNLDHYASFLHSWRSGKIDYDDREREVAIETDPEVAISLMKNLEEALVQLEDANLDTSVHIQMDDGGIPEWSQSTLRRELQFLLSHTIHHYALIVAIGHSLGDIVLPDGFGIAPSTLRHRESQGA